MWYTRAIPRNVFEEKIPRRSGISLGRNSVTESQFLNRTNAKSKLGISINGMKYARFLFTVWLAIFQEIVSKCDS